MAKTTKTSKKAAVETEEKEVLETLTEADVLAAIDDKGITVTKCSSPFYEVCEKLRLDGNVYLPGENFKSDSPEIERLIELGVLKKVEFEE